MNRIKIAHVLDSFDVGGVENGVINLVNGLHNFTHIICCISRLGASKSRVTRPDVVFYDLQKRGRDVFLPFKLAGIFKKEKPHIVHTRNWGAIDAIIGAKLAGVPVIVHSEHGVDFDTLCRTKRRQILARKLLFRLADRVFTVCQALKDRISSETGLPPDAITFILNGVDLDKYSVGRKNTKSAELGIDSRHFVVGSVGRLDLIKDYKTLLQAFKITRATRSNVTLLIVGDGPCRRALEELAIESGISNNVFFLGERHDVPDLLHVMDVFVLPSLSEGMSNTILEAMASGLPVIATEVGGNPELVEYDKNGYLFRREDHQALAMYILKLILNPDLAARLGHWSRVRAETLFSLSRMLSDYERLYLSLSDNQTASGSVYA